MCGYEIGVVTRACENARMNCRILTVSNCLHNQEAPCCNVPSSEMKEAVHIVTLKVEHPDVTVQTFHSFSIFWDEVASDYDHVFYYFLEKWLETEKRNNVPHEE